MERTIDNIPLASLLDRFAERVVTDEGNVYYRIPYWIQYNNDITFTVHVQEPTDLSDYITSAGLGGHNKPIEKPKL